MPKPRHSKTVRLTTKTPGRAAASDPARRTMSLRLPSWLHAELVADADHRGMSVNALVLFLLERELAPSEASSSASAEPQLADGKRPTRKPKRTNRLKRAMG